MKLPPYLEGLDLTRDGTIELLPDLKLNAHADRTIVHVPWNPDSANHGAVVIADKIFETIPRRPGSQKSALDWVRIRDGCSQFPIFENGEFIGRKTRDQNDFVEDVHHIIPVSFYKCAVGDLMCRVQNHPCNLITLDKASHAWLHSSWRENYIADYDLYLEHYEQVRKELFDRGILRKNLRGQFPARISKGDVDTLPDALEKQALYGHLKPKSFVRYCDTLQFFGYPNWNTRFDPFLQAVALRNSYEFLVFMRSERYKRHDIYFPFPEMYQKFIEDEFALLNQSRDMKALTDRNWHCQEYQVNIYDVWERALAPRPSRRQRRTQRIEKCLVKTGQLL